MYYGKPTRRRIGLGDGEVIDLFKGQPFGSPTIHSGNPPVISPERIAEIIRSQDYAAIQTIRDLELRVAVLQQVNAANRRIVAEGATGSAERPGSRLASLWNDANEWFGRELVEGWGVSNGLALGGGAVLAFIAAVGARRR